MNCLLLLAVVVTVRPFRTWIERQVVALTVHSDLRVHEVRLHRNRLSSGHSLLQATQFDWAAAQGTRYVGLSAQNAWFVVEDKPLANKEIVIPKALLQNSRLTLDTVSTRSHTASRDSLIDNDDFDAESIWQQFLEERMGGARWTNHRNDLDQAIQSDSFIRECGLIVGRWLICKEELAHQAEQLIAGNDTKDNPLRSEIEIRDRLRQLDALAQKEDQVNAEFESIRELVSNKLKAIGQLYEREKDVWGDQGGHAEVAEVAVEAVDGLKGVSGKPHVAVQGGADSAIDRIATSLVKCTGHDIINQFKVFGEVADILCRSSINRNSSRFNRDFRAYGQTVLSLDNLTASGLFRCDSVSTPFWMQSSCNASHGQAGSMTTQASFHFQFDKPPYSIFVKAMRAAGKQENQIQIEIRHYNKPAQPSPWDGRNLGAMDAPQWTLTSDGHHLHGRLTLDAILIPFLAAGVPDLDKSIDQWIELDASGQPYDRATLELSGTSWRSLRPKTTGVQIPQWLKSAIEASEHEQRLEIHRNSFALVEQYFNAELARLDWSLNQMLNQTQQHAQQFDSSLATIRTSLNQQLDQLNKTEFARTPDEDVKR